MQKLRFKRFDKPQFLKRIRRELLARFFARFDSGKTELALPPPDASDAEYFAQLCGLMNRPERLPCEIFEALFAIEEMSCAEGMLRLERMPEWARLRGELLADATAEDMAMQVWLVAPEALARANNALRLRRLTVFEHAGAGEKLQTSNSKLQRSFKSQTTNGLPNPGSAGIPAGLTTGKDAGRDAGAPRVHGEGDVIERATIVQLTIALDAWFLRNHRGAESARVEVYAMDGELWFLIRHGDVFKRVAKVDRQETEILHFRPERDDVVVYSPRLNEPRVNARTKSERDLYFEQFGLYLRGDRGYFSERHPYTLEPLRQQGRDALEVEGIEGIRSIRLRELEVARDNHQREVITRQADDLFECGGIEAGHAGPIPMDGRLARAVFDIQFKGLLKAEAVEIRLPNVLKVGRRCDFRAVEEWLCVKGFRKGGKELYLSKGE